MSDTPRTDAVYFKQGATMYDLANEMKLVERELNAANERIKRLEEELMDTKNKHSVLVADVVLNEDRAERIKQLEKDSERLAWLLKTGLAWRGCYNDCWIEGTWLYSSQYAIATIDKAKDAK